MSSRTGSRFSGSDPPLLFCSIISGQVRGDFLHERATDKRQDLQLFAGKVSRGDAEPERAQLPHLLPALQRHGRGVEEAVRHHRAGLLQLPQHARVLQGMALLRLLIKSPGLGKILLRSI